MISISVETTSNNFIDNALDTILPSPVFFLAHLTGITFSTLALIKLIVTLNRDLLPAFAILPILANTSTSGLRIGIPMPNDPPQKKSPKCQVELGTRGTNLATRDREAKTRQCCRTGWRIRARGLILCRLGWGASQRPDLAVDTRRWIRRLTPLLNSEMGTYRSSDPSSGDQDQPEFDKVTGGR
ncbi:hypothetical protein F5B19DRAFT_110496 [Rostrohypoxylon terebratum]|nr:hypothetical protein F5B19DRAFT_110496 [Rostrohypoxylon terebratum]